jgi:tetratricopeptide (TPR) repeat protein
MPTVDEVLSQGWQLHQAGRIAEAEHVYRQVLAVQPHIGAAWCYLGMACHDQERFEDALFAYDEAIVFEPMMPQAYQNKGKTLGRMRRFDEAIACFERAIAISPSYVNAYRNKAKALFFKGDLDGAMQAHRQLLALAPDDVETHMSIGMQQLSLGDAAGGWREYEWRYKTKDGALPELPQPLWDGSPLGGKSILLTPEQGMGDSIQFVRYGAELKKHYDCRVAFQCPRALVELLASCPGIDELVEQGKPPPKTDWFAPLLHVPAMLGQGPADFPGNVPYLSADASLVATWRQRLAAYAGRKVGIAWRGSPKHPADRMRSIALSQFAPLASVPDVRLFSLQKGPGHEELAPLAGKLNIVDLGSQLDEKTGAFVETGAVLKNLDLLIACDTAAVHVAGALGVPVWVAVGNVPDWRWLFGRDDSPAYPTLRLFRQASFGDWPGVFRRMAEALAAGQATKA